MSNALRAFLNLSTLAQLDAILDSDEPGGSASVREGSLEFHYFISRGELRRGEDLAHGVHHLVEVLAAAPAHPPFLALVEAYDRASGGIEALLPARDSGQLYYANEALRALAWMKQGRLADGVDLLIQVARAKPDVHYLDAWVLDRLVRGIAPLGPELGAHLITSVLMSFPEYEEMTARRVVAARKWARLAIRFGRESQLPRETAPVADMMISGLCRKAGLYEEGLALLEEAIRSRPSWHAHTARALLLRRAGDLAAAQKSFEHAIAIEPHNDAAYLEAGDMFFENERWTDARSYYEQVLQRNPDHPWALPSALFCAWRQQSSAPFPDGTFPDALDRLARDDNSRALGLYDPFRPFVGYVPEPFDATTNAIRNLVEKVDAASAKPGQSFKLTTSDVEAPSNRILMRLLYGDRMSLDLRYGNVASPDPREPHSPVRFRLWRLENEVLVPALPAPSKRVADTVRALATKPFHIIRTWSAASRLAADLRREDVPELLACVVHPLAMPDGSSPRDAFSWVPRVQVCALLTAAQICSDEQWNTSIRRDALLSVLHGPMDWSTSAAIVALARVAYDDNLALLDVHCAFAKLDASRPDSGAVPWLYTLLDTWLHLPGLYPKEHEELRSRRAALEA